MFCGGTAVVLSGTIIWVGCVERPVMGWIKAELDDVTHEAVRIEVEDTDAPTHEVAAQLIKERLEQADSMIEARGRLMDNNE